MIFSNLNTLSITIFTLLFAVCLVVFYFQFRDYKKTRNKHIFYRNILLIVSTLILLLPIFSIKKLTNQNNNLLWTNIVFVLDVSKSMKALDFQEDNTIFSRLVASKHFIENFVSKNTQNKYALVVFAWDTQRVLPFTTDAEFFLTMLENIDENNVTKQWTNLEWAIKDWFKNFIEDNKEWVMVVLSDWSDEEVWLSDLKDEKNNKNIKTLVIWVGSTKWAYIPIWQDPFWQIIYKTYWWQKVLTKLNEESLQKIASYFSGEYYNLSKLTQIESIESLLKDVSKKSILNTKENYLDMTRYIVMISFILFCIYLVSLFKYVKNK